MILLLYMSLVYVGCPIRVKEKDINEKQGKVQAGLTKDECEGKKKGDLSSHNLQNCLMTQYRELLEVHRSYFSVFLQTLSIYLIVMGGCAKVIWENWRDKSDLQQPEKRGSAWVLIGLTLFATFVSVLFLMGMHYGEKDAIIRGEQIKVVACSLGLQPVDVGLFLRVIKLMTFGTWLFIFTWPIALIIRIFINVKGFWESLKAV